MTQEQRIRDLGKRISKIYKQANEELTEKVDSFFANFEKLDKKQKALVDAKKLSEEDYKKWRKNKLLMGEKYKQLRDNVGQTMLEANKTAAAYINREMIPSYATGYNTEGKNAESKVNGYSFDLIDENAVKRLTTSNKTILPYKVVDGRRDVRWNTKHVNSAILQGIIQGDSIPKIAKRLEGVTKMNRDSAIRNARTAVTGAHNSGRQDAMHKLSSDGVIVQKEWLASIGDSRTRDAHIELHHVVVDEDKPFENSIGRIMFPGDPNAHPANVYNCRCAMVSVIKGFRKGMEPEPEEQEYDGPSYYAPIDEMTGMIQEQKEVIEKRFKELDSVYHANVDGGVHGLLERDQAEYDLQYKQYYEHLLEENPRMRKSTAKKRTDELMGPRPEYDPGHGKMRYLEVGGEYREKDNVFTMIQNIDNWQDFRHTITINPHSIGANDTLSDDIQERIEFNKRQEQRRIEGRRLRTRSNVGQSLEGTFIHEYGHAIDYTYGVSEHPDFLAFYNALTEDEIKSVSGYAQTNEKEFIAEAFCESFMGETQGEVSKRFMKVLEGILSGKR